MNYRLKGQMAAFDLNETSGSCDARRLNRKDPDEVQQRTLVVEAAKLGFSMLASCAELIEKDLDYAYILLRSFSERILRPIHSLAPIRPHPAK